MALPTFIPGGRLIDGADLNTIVTSINALAAANSVSISPALSAFQVGPRLHRGENLAAMMAAVQAVGVTLSTTIPTMRGPLPGHRMYGGTELNTLVSAIKTLGGS
jgi:hypothetical protein